MSFGESYNVGGLAGGRVHDVCLGRLMLCSTKAGIKGAECLGVL